MIRLHPIPDVHPAQCPSCHTKLDTGNWHIIGARNIVERTCPACATLYYQDLPVSHAIHNHALFDVQNNVIHTTRLNWYTEAWQTLYHSRSSQPVQLDIETHRELGQRPIILLNTLDNYYGHSILKLLNADYYLREHPDHDLIILVQPFIRWLVPEGAAQIWTAHIPLRDGDKWYTQLALRIHDLLQPHKTVFLSLALSHPDARDFDIENFSRIPPFDMAQWDKSPLKISFIWRDDRLWQNPFPIGRLRNLFVRRPDGLTQQHQHVHDFARLLYQLAPDAQLSVIGIAQSPSALPDNIKDMRTNHVTTTLERDWVQAYAESHIVIGVHGSNMLLPSAHAGASIALMPPDRWANQVQDTIVKEQDPRLAQIRHKHISMETQPATLARIALRTYQSMAHHIRHYTRPHTNHKHLQAQWQKTSES